VEENSNIQEEVKTEIKQENNQDDEIEILEVEEVKEKKDFSNVLSGIFKNKKTLTAAGIVAVVIAAAVTCVVISVNKRGTKQTLAVEETTTQAETVTQEQTTEEPKKLENLMLEANAEESSITAHFVNESGEAVTGHNFAVRLLSGSIEENQEKVDKLKNDKKSGTDNLKESTAVQTQENGSQSEDVVAQTGATEYEDDNQDGEVVITDLNEGTYTLVAKAYEGFALPDAAEVSLVKYTVIENILESVVYEDESTIKEDPENGRDDEPEDEPVTPNGSIVITPPSYSDDNNGVVSHIKTQNDSYVYETKNVSTAIFSDSDIASYEKAACFIENNDEIKEFEGLVKERTTVSVTDGDKSVISTFLVKSDKKQESQTTAEKETQTASDGKLYDVYTLSPVLVKEYGDGWHNIGGNRYYYRGSQRVTGWQNIDGLQYYFDGNGKLSSCTMIDVSTYNGDIDWNAVKAAGVDYAIIRVGYRGYGTARLVQDRRFEQNMRGAINAGIRVGAYIVTQAVNTEEAVEEASFIVEKCRGYNVTLPLAIDVEWAGNSYEEGRANSISASTRTDVINAFARTVMNSGYTAMAYANKDWFENKIYSGNLFSSCKIWLAQYRNTEYTYGGRVNMWQYTSKGRVDGINGDVDISAWVY
jgi:GH25 family lysozyme M1 (1,4-beta-N-acetylmuramidase)/preprotein translocase subunit YajC